MAETPPWVLLVGYGLSGGLGIIGTLAGQWVTGKRSDKERVRSDERAGQDRRRGVYEDFLAAVWEAYDGATLALMVTRGRSSTMPEDDARKDFFNKAGRVVALLARVQLVGSAEASHAGADVANFLNAEAGRCFQSQSDEWFDLKRLHELIEGFIRAARADTGAPRLWGAPARAYRVPRLPDQPSRR